ncbi:aspartyl-phosphate phosphatase Spo0E family protein [Cytobacillus sp. IB215665]|uniref:aspartyl-phosphate phosphatase Spo0E family protein n=1 Tax=Cytobacillus sp. IB215665 TaxID=3097357 RepID=UPI002A13842C|nr:aspartyl-phosphate phosphatase Spo0E family protein [Cytobacillus sp. IB215665]MDX8365759.1 aspartyl-phosphate phosphatase Spo0E family protein [Cytobacillus sp. IB215665]
MNKLNSLQLKIDKKRKDMLTLASKRDYSSKEVVKCSQELDKLIYKYQQLTLKKQERLSYQVFFFWDKPMKKGNVKSGTKTG